MTTMAAFCIAHTFATVPLGTGFTYQGGLSDAGVPANGNYDMIFNLYDAPTNGNAIGSFSIFGAVPVSNGLFTVELNSYNEFGPTAFNGQARWLQVGVRTNSNSALNPWIYLEPRQPLDPTPLAGFALNASNAVNAAFASSVADGSITGAKLAPGAVAWNSIVGIPAGLADGVDNDTTYTAGAGLSLGGTNNQFSVNFAGSGTAITAARTDHNHFGAAWGGSAAFGLGLTVTNGAANGVGLYGQQGSGSGFPYIFGNTAGVWGESSSGSGVFGATGWTNGSGVSGWGVATNGPNAGVSGQSMSISGIGVSGLAVAVTGPAVGVRGQSKSSGGYGIVGYASALSGGAAGVYGQSDAVNGSGLVGRSTFVSGVGPNFGVYGQSDSLWGYGVFGYGAASSGVNFGVVGQSDAPGGYGVVARNNSGVSLKAEGTGIIQSDADSIIWIPGCTGLGWGFGGPEITDWGVESSASDWDLNATFPITVPGLLYGQPTTVKSVEIFYHCDDPTHGYISATEVMESDNLTPVVHDPTARKSDVRTSYTLPVNYMFTDKFLSVTIRFHFVDWTRIYVCGVKVRLGHA